MDQGTRDAWNAARPGAARSFDTACPAPWVSLEFDPAGWVLACCAGHLYPLGRIGDERLADLWGGPRAQVLRDALARWDLTVACAGCRWHLEHGRMDPVAAEYDRYPMTSADPAAPYAMQFALSNRCNLACRMCNPALSSRLRTEADLPPLEQRYDDRFFDDLRPLLGGLGLAKFQGGEPFLVPEHRRLWSMMAELPTPPRLLVTTNGTVWNDNVEFVLDHFTTDISVSVDAATPETYAVVRRGGDFSKLMANLDRFAERCRAAGSVLHVSYCLLRDNWHELGAFLRWAERFGNPVTVNLVIDEGLALHELPLAELDEIAERWAAEDRELGTSLVHNAEVWHTQLRQLDRVRAERRAGALPPSLHPDRATSALFDEPAAVGPDLVDLDEEVERLTRWCEGGPVGVVVADAGGTIVAVDRDHPRLGIGAALIGRHLGDLVDAVEQADGRPVWALDTGTVDGRIVRTLAVSTTASRGTPGTMVRTVEIARDDRRVVLVAEDRIYERSEVVTIRGRRAGSTP